MTKVSPIFDGVQSSTLRGDFQFPGGSDASGAVVRALAVKNPEPWYGEVLCLLDAFRSCGCAPRILRTKKSNIHRCGEQQIWVGAPSKRCIPKERLKNLPLST